ncbi:hypothetical protein HYALB_00012016 [Hymenoscyphus albidus]|uniref:Uncharacterized protein n=1 Tax=Hymenoscyphus albidus TaxID=595503 RepID=A0A9N9LN06_9HELO|nr:hypothetical protein HYALB_00012016 [Hymenoscyphus albidus]
MPCKTLSLQLIQIPQSSKRLLPSPKQQHSPPPPPYTANSSSSSTRSYPSGKTPSSSGYPTPPASASPTKGSFHPTNPYSSSASSQRQSLAPQPHRRRGSSLGERFPGDMSHRPLDQIRKETKAAHRSPHLRKKAIPGADVIDSLDQSIFGAYHHEGPYDATLMSRNRTFKNSPVAAVRDSNNEALKATPAHHIRDALDKHVPLSGVATIPPGMAGFDGKVMDYEEGADLMRESDAGGGAYKRWDHIKYLPEDLKGKGEPSYSIEKSLKKDKHISRNRGKSVGEGNSYEMQPQRLSRHRSVGNSNDSRSYDQFLRPDHYSHNGEGSSSGGGFSSGLKKRFGSFRRKKTVTTEV